MSEVPNGSAKRLIHLLKLVAAGPYQFSLSDLVARSGMPASSVHRILQEMVHGGLVERGKSQSYKPGRELHWLASQLVARFDLSRSARPFLETLVEEWHETAVLCTYSPSTRSAIIADAVLTPHPLRFAVECGREISLPWGSLGRAILAYLSPGEIESIIRTAKAGPLSGRPRAPRAEIENDLSVIRANGYSRFYDPDNDIAGLASPIFGAQEEILGCIGVTMPSKRYHIHLEDDLAIAVRNAARALSEKAAIAYS